MTYKMKLTFRNFFAIQEHKKTIEMRLNDEKRKDIKPGDTIIFTDLRYGCKLDVEVLEVEKFKNFEELYKNYHKVNLGYLYTEEPNPKDMLKYYTKEQQDKYGVLAIKIKPIKELD